MKTRSFEIKTGLTVKASPAAVAFLWSNWDVCDQLNNRALSIRRLGRDSWSGKGWGGSAEWHLLKAHFTVDQGCFEFLAFGRFLGSPFRGQVTAEYRRLDTDMLSYVGGGEIAFTSRCAPLARLVEICGPRGANYANRTGARLAELITEEPALLKECAGDAAWRIYQDFREEYIAITKGISTPLRHFTKQSAGPAMREKDSDVEVLRHKLSDLEEKIRRLNQEIDLKEYYLSLAVFSADPSMALVKNRAIVERIAGIVYVGELKQHIADRRLEELIAAVSKQSAIPENVVAAMRTVQLLGNPPAHAPKVGRVRSTFNAWDFSLSFIATLRITEWFFFEYHSGSSCGLDHGVGV